MAYKLINATETKVGTAIIIDGAPCIVKSIDISKTGKHGASKARIEAIGVIDDKKRIVAVPGHERLEVPLIEKKRGQVLSVNLNDNIASIMDTESYETLDVSISEEAQSEVKEGVQIEYWVISNKKIIKRVS